MKITKSEAQEVLKMIERRKLNWSQVHTVFAYLKALLMKSRGQNYIYWMKYLTKLMALGYGQMVSNDVHLQKHLIEMFSMSFKQLMVEPSSLNFSYTVFQITVIADLIRISPQSMYPYNKEFMQNAIKLSQLASIINKESQGKISLRLFIVYFSFTNNPELYSDQKLFDTFKNLILAEIDKSVKQYKYEHYDILCQTYENMCIKINQNHSKSHKNHTKPSIRIDFE